MDFYKGDRLNEEGRRLYNMGEVHIRKVCVVFLCGGQGTRLGSDKPKGCFILPKLNMCLFEVHFQKIRELQRRYNAKIKVFLMTSTFTYDDTKKFLDGRDNFDLDITLFNQENVECLDLEMKLMKYDENSTCKSPNGNGGLFKALYQYHIIDKMKECDIEYVNVVSVDNILVNVCDPLAIGVLYDKNLDILSKAVIKADDEGVGVFVKENGHYVVKEYFESKESSKLANICHHYFRLDFLEKLKNVDEAYHLSMKKIPYCRNGSIIKPDRPNGYKQELFIFDFFKYANGNEVILVPRLLEFSPLKNSDKDKGSNPTTCVSDYLKIKSTANIHFK